MSNSREVYDLLKPGDFKKNIPYLNEKQRKALLRMGVQTLQQTLRNLEGYIHADAATEYEAIVMRECQVKYGAQLYIEQKLSDEMLDVDLKDISENNIVFPYDSMEFYFDDPRIPTFIFQKHSESETRRDWLLGHSYHDHRAWEDGFRMCFFGGGIVYTNIYPMKEIRTFLDYQENVVDQRTSEYSLEDTDFERRLRRFLFLMAVKILLYISIPKYKAIRVTKSQVHPLSRPGVKNRPDRPILKVIYVPSEVEVNQHKSVPTGVVMPPHRRRGHFRMLRDEKFRNQQGETIFVKPCLIHGGSVGDQLYVVRKAS